MQRSIPLALALLVAQAAAAQCIIGNAVSSMNQTGTHRVGQSFTATCNGTIEYVEYFSNVNGTNTAGTLMIYSGSTVSNTPIHTQEYDAIPVTAGGPIRAFCAARRFNRKGEKGMALPDFSMRQLLEAGVHFGHQTHRWNPRMGPYIYGARNGIHIVDLTQTVPLLDQALQAVQQTVAKGGRILFVGTKRQAQKAVHDAAERSAQYYMNHRWLGGTLTNWKTVSASIARLRAIDEKLETGAEGLTKKERLGLERDQAKLQQSLGGIREMGGVPDMLFVIDTNKEGIAIKEAQRLNVPVAAVVDTNCDPDVIDYIIPSNDDAIRAIKLITSKLADAAIEGRAMREEALVDEISEYDADDEYSDYDGYDEDMSDEDLLGAATLAKIREAEEVVEEEE